MRRRSSYKGRGKRKNFRPYLIALLSLMLGAVLLLFLVLEGEPAVVETAVPTVDSAVRARNLAKVILRSIYSNRETASISASEQDLNALMTLAARGTGRFSGRVIVTPGVLFLKTSWRFTSHPLATFLNLRVELLPDRNGLNIRRVKVGRVPVPRILSLAMLRGILNLGMGRGEGTALIESVQAVHMSAGTITIDLGSVPRLRERLKRLQVFLVKLHGITRLTGAFQGREAVDVYYMALADADRRLDPVKPPSLAAYIGPLFRLARERSAEGDPVQENRGALLALAIYLGDPRFDKLAGSVLKPGMPKPSKAARMAHLGGRRDLRLHFVVSAGLKVLTDQGLSTAIGEFKELLDAGNGGSGFSFVDLAADRAGIRFARMATDPAGGALRLQRLLSGNPAESLFFPSIDGLPENMSKDQFEREYEGVDRPKYNGMVREIDRRIDECPAYRRK